jgi:hypothetical protein
MLSGKQVLVLIQALFTDDPDQMPVAVIEVLQAQASTLRGASVSEYKLLCRCVDDVQRYFTYVEIVDPGDPPFQESGYEIVGVQDAE